MGDLCLQCLGISISDTISDGVTKQESFSQNVENRKTVTKNWIFLLFRQNIPLGELIRGKMVLSSDKVLNGRN